jgi:hypothetical protein
MKKITILSLFSLLTVILFLKGNLGLVSLENLPQSLTFEKDVFLNPIHESEAGKVGVSSSLREEKKSQPLNGPSNTSAMRDEAQDSSSAINPSIEIARINSSSRSRSFEDPNQGNNMNRNLAANNLQNNEENPEIQMEMNVPRGARLPAAIVDASANLTPAQAEVLDRISEDFLDAAVTSNPGVDDLKKNKAAEKKWSQSLIEANERYRSLYGVDAYNARTIQAAKEALADLP